MSAEDMEIMTDLGQPGFSEDIDIDIDFGADQPDEDLELTDFDQAQDATVFNMDPKDEMMDDGDGDGDNESYSMIDADDENHHEATTSVANDIEIDIGGLDEESMWPGDGLAEPQQASQEVQDLSTSAMGANIGNGNGQEDTNPLATLPDAEGDMSLAGTDVKDYAAQEVDSHVPIAASTATEGADLSALGADQVATESLDATGVQADPETAVHGDGGSQTSPEEGHGQDGPAAQGTADSVDADADADTDANDEIDWNAGAETDQSTKPTAQDSVEETREDEGSHDNTEEKSEQTGAADAPSSRGDEVTASGDVFDESHVSSEMPNDGADSGARGEIEELQENEENDDQDNTSQDVADGAFNEAGDAGQNDHDEWAEDTAQADEEPSNDANPENAATIAGRHQMFISYGETDYRLFAKSEDDDPNQYFLSDVAALDLPLSGFLSSLRDVISEEVSPLDELVMHVDGLGLEFSESYTPKFLEQYTFGHLVRLYDDLVRNDETDSTTDLYTYLMVRPSCQQRLSALFDSAKAGRGLSEIAVYRESTPPLETVGLPSRSNSSSPLPDDEEVANDDYAHDEASFNIGHEAVEAGHAAGGEGHHGEYKPDEDDVEEQYDDEGQSVENADFQDHPDEAGGEAYAGAENTGDYHGDSADVVAETTGDAADQAGDDIFDLSEPDGNIAAVDEDQSNDEQTQQDHSRASPEEHHEQSVEGLLQATLDQQGPDGLGSGQTSATATLNGDNNDVIDYSEDEDENTGADTNGQVNDTDALQVPVDDEITWESENEEPSETPAAQQPAQVSPAHGKRNRSDIEDGEDQGSEIDVKRHRS